MSTKSKTPKRPTKDQARAWLATVVAPLVGALEVEARVTQANSWSFRHYSRDFELLLPSKNMVAVPFVPNLTHFLHHHAEVSTLLASHDSELAALRSACTAAYDALFGNDNFQQLVETASGTSSDDARNFAQYVINAIRELPPDYTTSGAWNPMADRFLALREAPALKPAFDQVLVHGNKLGQVIVALRSGLVETQQRLADQFGLPPVEPDFATR